MKLFPVCFNIVVFTDHFEIDSAFHATLNAAQPRKKMPPGKSERYFINLRF